MFQPGANTGVTTDLAAAPSRTGTWLDLLQGLIPADYLGLAASSSVATTTDGVVSVTTGLSFTRSFLAVVQKVLWWVIRLAPLGTLGLVGRALATYGWGSLASLGWFTVAVYAGLALVLFVVYPVLLRAHGLTIGQYFRGRSQRSSSRSSPAPPSEPSW